MIQNWTGDTGAFLWFVYLSPNEIRFISLAEGFISPKSTPMAGSLLPAPCWTLGKFSTLILQFQLAESAV